MLYCAMYHRINNASYSNSRETLDAHLAYLAERFKVVLPGERLSSDRPNICITFDDALYDVYHYLYPLLRKHRLRALVAVPAKFIMDATGLPAEERLSVPHAMAHKEGTYQSRFPFCTWQELTEMADAGSIALASHSFSHCALRSNEGLDLEHEIAGSKRVISEKTGHAVETFIYPFGAFEKSLLPRVKQSYRYAMRIGNALNYSWQNNSGVIYRINGDGMRDPFEMFRTTRKLSYLWKLAVNTARGR